MQVFRILISSVVGVVFLSTAAVSAEYSGSGTVTFVGNHIGSRGIANGNSLGQDHLRGVMIADDAANPLNLAAQDCIGSSIVAKDGVPGEDAGYCDGIDKDGDVFFMWYRNKDADNRWGFLGGTGKFEGITGGGTTTYVAGEPADRLVVKWEGKWTTAK